MYLAGKVSRGKGERIAVILFSDQPVTVSFGHSQYFDAATAGRDVNKIAEAIISSVENIKKRSTRMGPALKSSLDLARMFDQKRPKMLVMLTDGRPDDAELAEQMVYQSIANRKDMILFIAGMGEEVDQDLMQRWAGATGGEYIHVKDLNQLADWYSSLAKKLTFRADMDNLNRNGVR
jgi:hypothetical protein